MKTEKIFDFSSQSLSKETVCFKVPSKSLEGKQIVIVPEGWEALVLNDAQLGKILKRGSYKMSSIKEKSKIVELVFYSTTTEFSFLWGTKQQMDFSDAVFNLQIKMGANGKLGFLVKNIRNLFLTAGQTQTIDTKQIKAFVVDELISFLQENIDGYVKDKKLSFLDFEKEKNLAMKSFVPQLSFFLQNKFGLKLSSFVVDGVIFDKKLFKALENEKQKLKQKIEEKEQIENQEKNIILHNNIEVFEKQSKKQEVLENEEKIDLRDLRTKKQEPQQEKNQEEKEMLLL